MGGKGRKNQCDSGRGGTHIILRVGKEEDLKQEDHRFQARPG